MRMIGIIGLLVGLTACAAWQGDENNYKTAACNEMKHRMIFNGTSINPAEAMQQRTENDRLNRSYIDMGCK